jgi:hypothetical protein
LDQESSEAIAVLLKLAPQKNFRVAMKLIWLFSSRIN